MKLSCKFGEMASILRSLVEISGIPKKLLKINFLKSVQTLISETSTVIIQHALHFPDLGECFTQSERMSTTHENFSTGF